MGDQKSEIDRDEVRKIIKTLKGERDKFDQTPGNMLQVEQYGNITVQDLGNYPAGKALGDSTDAAYTEVYGQYNAFISSFEGVIKALEKMVGNHDEKEQTNTAATSRVMSSDGGNPTRGNSHEWGS